MTKQQMFELLARKAHLTKKGKGAMELFWKKLKELYPRVKSGLVRLWNFQGSFCQRQAGNYSGDQDQKDCQGHRGRPVYSRQVSEKGSKIVVMRKLFAYLRIYFWISSL